MFYAQTQKLSVGSYNIQTGNEREQRTKDANALFPCFPIKLYSLQLDYYGPLPRAIFFCEFGLYSTGFPIPNISSACKKPLGMESGRISSTSVTASSLFGGIFTPANARLHFQKGAWWPRISDHNQWLRVDFEIKTQVTGISTQGHFDEHGPFVKSYSLRYSNDDLFFTVYESEQGTKVKLLQIIS